MAALQLKGGKKIVSLPRPARHHDVMNYMDDNGFSRNQIQKSIQGFVTSDGEFVDRVTALKIALGTGQVVTHKHLDKLFSEDMW